MERPVVPLKVSTRYIALRHSNNSAGLFPGAQNAGEPYSNVRHAHEGIGLMGRASCYATRANRNPGQGVSLESPALVGDAAPRDATVHPRRRPTTSVVIAWRSSPQELDRVLGLLADRCQNDGAELIVVRASGAVQRQRLQRLFPNVHLVSAPAHLGLAELRQIGAARATGDILVVLDDAATQEPRLPLSDVLQPESPVESGSERIDLLRSLQQYGVEVGAPDSTPPTPAARDEDRPTWVRFFERVTDYARLRRAPALRDDLIGGPG